MDWEEFLGRREYQKGWVDFMEDELVRWDYEWKGVVEEWIVGSGGEDNGKGKLGMGLFGGLGNPLIHLGYAFEMGSKDLGMEGEFSVSGGRVGKGEY